VLFIRRINVEAEPVDRQVALRRMLDEAFENDFSDDDWDHALSGSSVVAFDGDDLVAHASVVPRVLVVDDTPVHVGYVEGVAVTPGRQGEGIGTLVMHDVAEIIQEEFEMGGLSTGSHAFYERLGWEPWQGPTFVRHGSDLVRSKGDDDGVMVLRYGPSEVLDLDEPISCEARAGDDW
jgi:aminoglycoside 2'-N-acetyltransferase I